jgi:hypothetical protein
MIEPYVKFGKKGYGPLELLWLLKDSMHVRLLENQEVYKMGPKHIQTRKLNS